MNADANGMPTEPRLKDAEWAAAYLGLTRKKLYELVEARQVIPIRLGRRVYFTRELLEQFISRSSSEAGPESGDVRSPLQLNPNPTPTAVQDGSNLNQ